MAKIRTAIRSVRQRQGVKQQELAARAGISRQALSELEAGNSCPSTAVALGLAKALHCRVEDLFALSEDALPIQADWVPIPVARRTPRSGRVALGLIGDRWVAHPLSLDQPASLCMTADGLAMSSRRRARHVGFGAAVRVHPLRSRSAMRENVLAAGCDPAMGLLSAWLGERHLESKLTWLYAPSLAALKALARGEIHVAGMHLLDEGSCEFNVPYVRSMIPDRSAVIVNLARWEEGFVVRAGNPLGIRTAHDLVRRDVSFVNREVGSEARKLVDRLLGKAGLNAKAVKGFQRIAHGHAAVANVVAIGAADVGIATRNGAARVARLVDAVGSRAFRRELASLGGYVTSQSGEVVAEVRPA